MPRPERPLSQRRNSEPRGLGSVIDTYLGDLHLLARAKEELAALHWRDVVGKYVARHTTIAGVREGTLTVIADSSALAQQLALEQGPVIARLNERLGGNYIHRIRLQSGRSWGRRPAAGEGEAGERAGEEHADREPDLAAIALLPAEEAQIVEIAARSGDEQLAATLRRMLTRQAKLRHWRTAHGLTTCERCGSGYDPQRGGCRVCAAIAEPPVTWAARPEWGKDDG